MRLTLGWLRDHLDTEASAEEIAEALTDIGLEVEEVADPARVFESIVVARVTAADPHPSADRLRVCQVNTGDGTVQVVCGAPNARAGMLGVFAPEGVRVPGTGFDLKATKIRGVESHGMLLSERELGVSDEHDGIVDLDSDAEVGTPYAVFAGIDDPVLTVGVTPNRPDALGARGIARDLAARGLGTLKPLDARPVDAVYENSVAVAIDPAAEEACPVIAMRHLRGLRNGASPDWMQRRLRAIGLRPISALVDITNYMTFDLCRPLHAFDADRLDGGITVRMAAEGETIKTLHGGEHSLDSHMTVIADEAGAQALGGVVGGMATACGPQTVSVMLESAYFDPVRTARTGRLLGLASDARFRFERGVDPEFLRDGLEIATRLILDICGGEASDITAVGAPPALPAPVAYRPARLKTLLAMDAPVDEQRRILEGLGFAVEGKGETLEVRPPSWRRDIAGEADIVEEVARIASLSRVPAVPLPRRRPGVQPPALGMDQARGYLARRTLAARGLLECVSYAFVSQDEAARFGGEDPALRIDNPISEDLAVMRPSLLPSLLKAAAVNRARGLRDQGLFEVGPEFTGGEPGDQREMAAALRLGDARSAAWNDLRRAVDLFDSKADAHALLEALGASPEGMEAHPEAPSWYHPGRSATLGLGPKRPLAFFGELHPGLLAECGFDEPVVALELRLGDVPHPRRRPRPPLLLSNYQAVERDFAFVVGEDVTAAAVVRAARSAERVLIESVRIFDVFEGESVGEGRRSLAIRVRLQPREGTLEEAEIEAVAQAVVAKVEKATGGKQRG